jgi:hypothetical protein
MRARLLVASITVLLCTAPTPGDVGGCGQTPQDLDPGVFFATKRHTECEQCEACAIPTDACRAACDADASVPDEFPEGCRPLVHDGEVCLRALTAASCSDYEAYMDDSSPQVPSECNFCPSRNP